jgi:hypothetical protein
MDKANTPEANWETWEEVENYLLERMESFEDDSPMVNNQSLTKKQYWNSQMGECMKYSGQKLPIRTRPILIKRIKENFG